IFLAHHPGADAYAKPNHTRSPICACAENGNNNAHNAQRQNKSAPMRLAVAANVPIGTIFLIPRSIGAFVLLSQLLGAELAARGILTDLLATVGTGHEIPVDDRLG